MTCKNKSEKSGRGLRTICILLIVLIAILMLIAAVALIVYSGLDTEGDRMLFRAAQGVGSPCYYASVGEYSGLNDYQPKRVFLDMNTDDCRIWCEYSSLPENLKLGFIATEDRKFLTHSGVDIRRTLLAAANQIFHIKGEFGASTITQQLIKNVSGDSERTFSRKMREILRAVSIERHYSKEEILELYANIAPMGEGFVGVGSAALAYFGKDVSDLTLCECATLVGITNAPTRYSPHDNHEAARARRDDVLFCMKECGYISDGEFSLSVSEPLSVLPKRSISERTGSWFVETVNDELYGILTKRAGMSDGVARALIRSGGLHILTTLDEQVQGVLDGVFENGATLPRQINDGLQGACVVVNSKNARLLGIVGAFGKKSADRLVNHATVPHTPGSALKPLALYAPLINMRKITPASVFDDVPVSFDRGGGYPRNYPDVYAGRITVSDALKYSKNTVAMRLYGMLGARRIYDSLVRDFGFDTLSMGGEVTDLAPAPLALGQLSYGVSLRRLTEAYTVFPSEGVRCEPTSILAVYDSHGNMLYEHKPKSTRIFDTAAARVMNKMLQRVVSEGTARQIGLKYICDTAGKTGTSGDDRDRLFVGYTPYYTCGIWVGYPSADKQIGALSKTHLAIWDEVMSTIHKNLKDDEKMRTFSTEGLVMARFCADSGRLLSDACASDARGERERFDYLLPETVPKDECDTHILVYYDTHTGAVAGRGCPMECIKPIGLLRITDRRFPYEITVSDAQYVYRPMTGSVYSYDDNTPYFYFELAPLEYVGKSKSERQFNRYCHEHNDCE